MPSSATMEAGADGIFAETAYDVQKIRQGVKVPVLANITRVGRTRCSAWTTCAPTGVGVSLAQAPSVR